MAHKPYIKGKLDTQFDSLKTLKLTFEDGPPQILDGAFPRPLILRHSVECFRFFCESYLFDLFLDIVFGEM